MTDADTTRTPTPPPAPPSDEPTVAPPDPGPSAAGPAPTPTAPQGTPPRAWRPPASDSGRNASLIFGAIILILGVWFFATNTLGLDLPDLDWGQLWPVILIAIGAWIVLTAMRQRAR